MEFKLILKFYLNSTSLKMFNLKIKLIIRMYKHCSPTYKYGGYVFIIHGIMNINEIQISKNLKS